MIDINKIRSNYQKLATINSKCDTVGKQQVSKLSQQTTLGQQKQLNSSNGKKLPNNKSQITTNNKVHSGVGTTLTAKNRSNSITTAAATSLKHSVRAANKNFFLSHEFKDQNFLREECKLAQAQVAGAGRANTQNSHHNIRHQSQQNLNNNNQQHYNTTATTASHYPPQSSNNNKYSKLTLLSRSAPAATTIANGMRRSTTAHSSSTAATPQMGTSVHRLDLGLQQFKVLPTTTTTAAALTKPTNPTAAATKSFLNSRHHLTTPVRPLVHRTIPQTVLTAATAHSTALTTASKISQNHHNHHYHNLHASSNSINNNNSSNGGISKSQNLQHQQQQQLHSNAVNSNNNNINCSTNRMNEHDDIKFIDSDEVSTVPANTVVAASEATALNPVQQRYASILNDISSATAVSSSGQKTRVRPKSTIICSSNNLVFEKINNYKYANGVACGVSGASAVTAALEGKSTTVCSGSTAMATTTNVNTTVNNLKHPTTTSLGIRTRTPTPPTTKTTATTTTATTTSHSIASSSRRSDLRYAGIDSNSIKASIAKFNSLSEQKRLPPLTGVTMRAHANSGSSSSGSGGSTQNLQHHRHSSDLDSCQTRILGNDSNSPTRSPYRSNASAVAAASAATATKVMASMQSIASSSNAHPHSHAIAISPLVSNASNCSGVNCNSLPLKSSSKGFGVNARPTEFSASSLTRDIRLQTAALSTSTTAPAAKTTEQRPSLPTAGTAVDIDSSSSSSVRSTSRNALPPSSPTSTRYWDRDSTRTSSTNYGSSTNADTIKSSSDEKSDGLCGLRNIGNTCFMNSVIQCLSHTIELTRYLKAYNSMRSSGTKDEQILKEFAKLIQEMWSGNTGSVTPSDLKRAFSAKHRMYSDFNQQDAQEFLRFFLDSLHSALNSGVKGEPLKIEDHLSDNKKAELTWEWYTRIENSLIRDLFVGQLKSTLRCTTCGNTSVTFDPFWDLSVPLPSSSRCKLDACLDLFIREEVLDGDEMPTCSKCKQRRKCTKSFSIQRFPKYLVIHLKRFSETRWSKMTNIVEFPTGDRELNMAPYGANSNTNMHYSLYAISNHMGSTAGGHYVALCKHPVSKKWHEFNDNIVSGALSENHLVSSSAYILFYERA